MAKEVCVLFVCDNFSFLLVQSFMHKLLYAQSYVHKLLYVQSYVHKGLLCEPLCLMQSSKKMGQGK
jgi:hypothetical protein